MDPTFYFLVFLGLIGACVLGTLVWQPPTRKCPACGEDIPQRDRRCRYCKYSFSRA